MSLRSALRKNCLIYNFRRKLLSKLRNRIYGLRDVHSTFFIQSDVDVSRDLKAGAYSYIGKYCSICPRVELGCYVMFAPRVTIVGGDHVFNVPGVPIIFAGRPEMPKTVIEDDVWVGINSTIMSGVRIGRGAIVAAGSVVTKDVAPYTICGGVPAKYLRDRFEIDEQRKTHDRMLDSGLYLGKFCDLQS
jgi:acetyltransferase-like isoleucine patch superfamily enzyme